MGRCEAPLTPPSSGGRVATGFVDGECVSGCVLPSVWADAGLNTYPAGSCPSGTVCASLAAGDSAGDLGWCQTACQADSECRPGYQCTRPVTPAGRPWTNGLCEPIDCNDGVHACPAHTWCEVGVDLRTPKVGRCHPSNIEHVVVVSQENHTFDSYFGRYCTAAAGSNPTCTSGPDCCEAAPTTADGVTAVSLTDALNEGKDHDHGYDCEVCQLNGGAMNQFTQGSCPNSSQLQVLAGLVTPCSSTATFATALPPVVDTYWKYAHSGALADRYFQPIAGGTASNDIYFATARFAFLNNDWEPNALGRGCIYPPTTDPATSPPKTLDGTTIADLLLEAGHSFAAYADGYSQTVDAAPECPARPNDCTTSFEYSCRYDPCDVPFQFYRRFQDNPAFIKDYERDFAADVAAGRLPDVSYVKFRLYRNEHPGAGTVSYGAHWVDEVVRTITTSPLYGHNTLILLTWDEGGGFYDHVTPPRSIETFPVFDPGDAHASLSGTAIPYGTRVPLLALGPFAKRGEVSHVVLEHSSIIKFLEFNFLGAHRQGALGARDAVVSNLGSLLDARAVGTRSAPVIVPSTSTCAPPVIRTSCASGLSTCGSACCPASSPFYCSTNDTCYPTAEAATASPCGEACTWCR